MCRAFRMAYIKCYNYFFSKMSLSLLKSCIYENYTVHLNINKGIIPKTILKLSTMKISNNDLNGQIVEFHIGRGGRFNNQGHLTFCGVGSDAKNFVENENFLAFENESAIVDAIEDEDQQDIVTDLITDLDNQVDTPEYKAFCEKYGNLGAVILTSSNGNYIGDYVNNNEAYNYDEDGQYDTTFGVKITFWNDLSDDMKDAILDSSFGWKFEQAFNVELDMMES